MAADNRSADRQQVVVVTGGGAGIGAAIAEAVGRTGALVIVEDSLRSFGMGGPILDFLMPDLFERLRTAPLRVTGDDVFSPVSRPLESYVHVRDADIETAITTAARAARPKR